MYMQHTGTIKIFYILQFSRFCTKNHRKFKVSQSFEGSLFKFQTIQGFHHLVATLSEDEKQRLVEYRKKILKNMEK